MKKRVAFALAALVLVAGLLEGFARVFGPGLMPANPTLHDDRHMPTDSLVGWRAQPGSQQDFGVPAPTYVNAHGIRGPEIVGPKKPDEMRILMLGDSTVYGVRVSDDETFSGKLELLLQSQQIAAQVLNAGCPGYSSWQALQILKGRLLELQPDIVVIATLWSDAQGADSPDATRYGAESSRSLLTHSAFYVWAREHIRKKKWQSKESERIEFRFGPSMPGAPPPPSEGMQVANKLAPTNRVPLKQYRQNLREMAAMASESGAVPVFLILPSVRDLFIGRVGDFRDAYREAMKEVAHDLKAPLVDSSEHFLEGDIHALFFDEVHPTARGHHRIAEALLAPVVHLKRR